MPQHFIPALDPIPLPAPYWLFKLLLLVTFTLHILAMNFMLGGIVVALAARWGGKSEHAARMFRDVAGKLPSLLPATVTLGVAPLLFLQVIYGQFFYTSSVVIAWPWFLVLVFLTVAYYGLYWVSHRAHQAVPGGQKVLLGSFLLIAAVGFLFSTNLTLSQTPAAWAGKYFADPAGWNLNLTEPTLVPRYLHFVTAAVAVGGLLLMLMAWLQKDAAEEYRRWVFGFGGKTFLYATMAQFVIGGWFLMSLPRAQIMLFMGDNPLAAVLLLAGIAAAGAAIMVVFRAMAGNGLRTGAVGGTGLTVAAVAAMAVLRDLLRDDYLKPYFHPDRFTVETQWSVLPLFLAIFLGGVALWLVMVWRYPFTARGGTKS